VAKKSLRKRSQIRKRAEVNWEKGLLSPKKGCAGVCLEGEGGVPKGGGGGNKKEGFSGAALMLIHKQGEGRIWEGNAGLKVFSVMGHRSRNPGKKEEGLRKRIK